MGAKKSKPAEQKHEASFRTSRKSSDGGREYGMVRSSSLTPAIVVRVVDDHGHVTKESPQFLQSRIPVMQAPPSSSSSRLSLSVLEDDRRFERGMPPSMKRQAWGNDNDDERRDRDRDRNHKKSDRHRANSRDRDRHHERSRGHRDKERDRDRWDHDRADRRKDDRDRQRDRRRR